MAKPGARPRDSWGPAPLLLAGLALLGAARARAAGGGFSLHPPYFNLAEGARIAASATCGEEAPARGAPRPTEDLYCKLVGGPVAGGDPNQTIQVSEGGRPGGGGGDARAGRAPGSDSGIPALLGEEPRYGPRPPPVPTPQFCISGDGRDPSSALRVQPEKCASRREGGTQPTRARPAPVEFGSGDELDGRGWCLVPGGPESWDPGEGGTWLPWPAACGEGADRSAFLRDRLEPAGDGMGQGWGRKGQTQEC